MLVTHCRHAEILIVTGCAPNTFPCHANFCFKVRMNSRCIRAKRFGAISNRFARRCAHMPFSVILFKDRRIKFENAW